MSQPSHPYSSAPSGPQSPAIFKGADLLIQLMEDEKAKISKRYSDMLRALETDYEALKKGTDHAISSAEATARTQTERMYELEKDMARTSHSAQGTRLQLNEAWAAYDHLIASLEAIGLEYVDGRIAYSQRAAQIMNGFLVAAHGHELAMRSTSGQNAVGGPLSTIMANYVGPDRMFEALDVVSRNLMGTANTNPRTHPAPGPLPPSQRPASGHSLVPVHAKRPSTSQHNDELSPAKLQRLC